MEWETTANTTSEESQCLVPMHEHYSSQKKESVGKGSGHRGPLASFDPGNAIKLQGTF